MAGEKRSQEHDNALREETIILVDIEGTTTSISYVKETLFPYVREHLKDYIEKQWDDAEFKAVVELLKEQSKKDETDKVEGFVAIKGESTDDMKESLLKNVLWQMDNDRKTGALKQLQGHIWRDAYKSGACKGHVYEDVPKALEAWTNDGRKIYVYSSGSVEAQKLLFGHSEHGDMQKYFTDYFDTEIGAKQEAASYKNILTKINCDASKVLFLTDIVNEAKAAIEAGMSSVIVIRDGNTTLTADDKTNYTTIQSFLELSFQASAKRPKLDNTDKEETKKVDEKVTDSAPAAAATTNDDVEMTDLSEKTKKTETVTEIKSATVDTEKEKSKEKPIADATVEPMESETTTVESECPKKESDDVVTKKIDEPVVSKASTSDATISKSSSSETESKTCDAKIDDKPIEPIKSSETTSKSTTESKTESAVEKKIDTKIETPPAVVETASVDGSVEKKIENKTDTDTAEVKKSVEKPKLEETPKEKKSEEIKETIATTTTTTTTANTTVVAKPEDKEPEEKTAVVEETKQNGDANKSVEPAETTSITNGSASTAVETNGDTKKEKETNVKPQQQQSDAKEAEKIIEKSENNETEPSKTADSVKDDDKATTIDAVVEKKLNGSTPTTTQDTNDTTDTKATHRNGVNDENNKQKNGGGDDSSTTDNNKDAIQVKKVVDSIADGAGEAEVVPPVAVVAATS